MKHIIKYFYFLFFLAAVNMSFASVSDDKYAFKFIEKKVYKAKTDIWVYQLFKNEKEYRIMNVYVTDNMDKAVILVDKSFDNSLNAYSFNRKKTSNNFNDSYRLEKATVYSLEEAVNLAVLHYIQDQIAD